MLTENIVKLKKDFSTDVSAVKDISDLEKIRIKYLGRNGIISDLFDQLKDVAKEEKPAVARPWSTQGISP